jgi:drug/metabolite transporter (DMT)-like permease
VPTPAPHNQEGSLGKTFFVLGVASTFAAGAVLAKLAYMAGSNALTIVTIRTIAACIWLVIFLKLGRIPLWLPARQRYGAFGLGVLLAIQTFGLYWAIEQMAAPLALITFCTYPMLIAAVQAITGHEKLTGKRVLAIVLAFSGLVVTLNTGSLRPTYAGIAAASIGSIAFTATMLLTQRYFPPGESRPRTAHMSASASVLFLIALWLSGDFATPNTTSGWVGFYGVCISFPIAVTGLFMAMQMLGPGRASVLLNFEPVAVTILSAIVLGQSLTGLQIVGAAMVIAAIITLQWSAPKKQAAPD